MDSDSKMRMASHCCFVVSMFAGFFTLERGGLWLMLLVLVVWLMGFLDGLVYRRKQFERHGRFL